MGSSRRDLGSYPGMIIFKKKIVLSFRGCAVALPKPRPKPNRPVQRVRNQAARLFVQQILFGMSHVLGLLLVLG